MMDRKAMMKMALAESLITCMRSMPFEKITIKHICDDTGVIRATFYNYFIDKYDALNYIVYQDVYESVIEFVKERDFSKSIQIILKNVRHRKSFYQQAFKIEGQNSFESMVLHEFERLILSVFSTNRNEMYLNEQFDDNLLAQYYSHSLTFFIRKWADVCDDSTIEQFSEKMQVLLTNSWESFIK